MLLSVAEGFSPCCSEKPETPLSFDMVALSNKLVCFQGFILKAFPEYQCYRSSLREVMPEGILHSSLILNWPFQRSRSFIQLMREFWKVLQKYSVRNLCDALFKPSQTMQLVLFVSLFSWKTEKYSFRTFQMKQNSHVLLVKVC